VSFLVAASLGAVPWWLAAVVIGRDVVLSTGVAIYAFVLHRRVEGAPTRFGKYATFFQLCTIGLALFVRAAGVPALSLWVAALVLITCEMTVVSGIQYVAGTLA